MRFADDLYVIDSIYQSYLKEYWNNERVDAIHFNHASITAPLPFIHKSSQDLYRRNLPPDSEERLRAIEDVRKKVGHLMNSEAPCVAFANNTTDAASLVFWLAGLKKSDNVVTTDAENESIPRIFKCYMDHANPGDGWVSWQNFAQHSNSREGLIERKPTNVSTKTVKAYEVDNESFLQDLINKIDRHTKLVVFCHVLRENGRILPVTAISRAIKEVNPNLPILVDGAQCLGTLPKIGFSDLGCDFYVATPHKTLCTETLGLLFIDPKQINSCQRLNSVPGDRQIIKKDQFSDKIGVRANSGFSLSLPEVYALGLAIDFFEKKGWLRRNDFSAVDQHLMLLKARLIEKLVSLQADVVSPLNAQFTNFICSFRLHGVDNRQIVMKLWEKRIFVSYIHRSNLIRTSFSINNSIDEVERFVSAIDEIIQTLI